MPMDDSYKPLLNREYAANMVLHFSDSTTLLNEVLDYGSFLLPRAYGSSPRDTKALCLIFVELRQFLAHLDGVAALASAGNCNSCTLQLRSLLEVALTMEWILKSDTEAKVNHLWVSNIRRRKHWQSIAIPGTPENVRRAADAARIPLTPAQLAEIQNDVRQLDGVLAQPEFSAINARFESGYASRGFDKPWYEVYGSAAGARVTIRKIAEDVGKLAEYQNFYSSFSSVSHGGDMWKNIVFNRDSVSPNPLREPEEVPKTVNFAIALAFVVFKMVLEQYRPGEVEKLSRKYVSEWQVRFLKAYSVKVTPQFTYI